MIQEIGFHEVKYIWENKIDIPLLYVYPDGTDAYISKDVEFLLLLRHYKNGGKFAKEVI